MKTNNNELMISFDKLEDPTVDFETPVPATVYIGDSQVEKFVFTNPVPADDLKELRWYVERSWQYRAKEEDSRIEKIETSLRRCGQDLFNAVFEKSARSMGMFERLMERRKAGKDCSIVIDTKEPRILRLPWELLADEGGYLFSRNPPVNIRRRMQKTRETDIRDFSLPVRVLMVVSRPEKAGFIDPRSSAEPLLDAFDELGDGADIEFLRPPTLTALMRRIRDKKQPPIHVVHFDGHGVYDSGIGLGFLLFEKDDHSRDMVDAERLGSLINECGIPLMILDACQSAEPDDRNPFGSVAARLIESGVGGVIAMNYSVLVETSKRLIGHFYTSVARGESVSSALGSARMELLADKSRHHYFSQRENKEIEVELQDWFVPALYQQADELIPFKPDTDGKSSAPTTKKATIPQQSKNERGGFPPAPLHGFHGRARELLDIERAFATRNIVVLHGFGGQGKTSLATQAAEWFTRTHLFERAAFVSFETGASFDFVLNELGNAFVEENFQIYQGDKVEAIARSLKEKPALVVFDNFESVLPNGNAPMGELPDLLNAASNWFGTSDTPILNIGSRLLITTRNTDIPHPAFTPSKTCLHKELEGLAASDALELAASILEAYSLPRPPRVPLEELLKFLKGHPLSLQLALPQLRDYSPGKLVEEYQSILPQMKKGAARERNESLEVSLRFSLDRLGADALNWLTRLWIFEGGAMEHVLLAITEIPEETWNDLKPQLTSTALIRAEKIPGLNVPFIHFHPTLAPYLKGIADNEKQETSDSIENRESEIVNRYWQVYYQFANQLYQDDTQHPIQARAIVLRELPNLKRALKRTLAAGALDEAVAFADRISRFLDNFGRWRERDEIAAEVDRHTSTQGNEGGKITKREYLTESGRGQRLLQQGRVGEAEKVFRALLARLEGDADYDTRYDQTLILRNIGLSLSEQGRPSQAVEFYQRAIALAENSEQTNTVRQSIGFLHADLADVLADLGQYAEARKNYESSLAIAQKEDNDRSAGVALGQLGTLALRQGDLNEARKRFTESLRTFNLLGEERYVAASWHKLGVVAQEFSEWDEAERCYKESLSISERMSNFSAAAQACNQLAIIAMQTERPQDAERWFLREIEIDEKLGDQKGLAVDYNNLAGFYLVQNSLDEAEAYIRRALAIKETLDLSSEPWTTYDILAEIAEKRGRKDDVREWRRKEQESFAAFAGSDQAIQQWQQEIAIMVSACQGNQESIAVAKQIVEKYRGDKSWGNLADAMQKVLDGQRNDIIYDGLDRIDALVIRRILQALDGDVKPSPQPSSAEKGGEGEGVTLPQLLEYVERAAVGGDKELGGQLFQAFQEMSRNEDKSLSALGNVLLRVLVGERNPSLDGLPDEVASAIRGMLGRLKNK